MPVATVLDAQLVHGSDGWTTLKSTRPPPKTLNSSSSCEQQHASAADRARCCKRHPKACLSAPRAGGARRAGGVRLRDDLFVVGPPDSPDPDSLVPVVRAYEACAAPGAAASALRNASRSAAPLAAPLPVAALVFFGTHLERLPLIRDAYAPYFASLVLMSPSPAIRQQPTRRGVHHRHCRFGIKGTYACAAEAAATHGSAVGIRGLLYFHFDMWVQPWRLLPSAQPSVLDAVWALPAGRLMAKTGAPTRLVPLECFDLRDPATYSGRYRVPVAPGSAQLRPAWTWDRDLPPAQAGLARACAGGRCSVDRMCMGWADLYYVPRRLYAPFATLARAFANANATHASGAANAELAVPTILRILSEWPAAEHAPPTQRVPCWGYCCAATSCPELVARHACGHRMRLENGDLRATFESLWRQRAPRIRA